MSRSHTNVRNVGKETPMTIAYPDDPLQIKFHVPKHKRVTTVRRLPDNPPFTLKDCLIDIGLKALGDGDQCHVELVTMLIREGGLTHE
jgi:hypothetical protein